MLNIISWLIRTILRANSISGGRGGHGHHDDHGVHDVRDHHGAHDDDHDRQKKRHLLHANKRPELKSQPEHIVS